MIDMSVNSITKESINYKAYVNGQDIHVFDMQMLFDGYDETRMIHHPYYSSYIVMTAEGETCLEVTPLFAEKITDVNISPASKGVGYTLDREKIVLKVKPGDKLHMTVNGEVNRAFMIFVNSPQAKPEGEDIIYFGPGEHYIEDNEYGMLKLKSGQTVYLDDGAMVYGRIYAKDCDNIKIAGNGIICSSRCRGRWAEWLRGMVDSDETLDRVQLIDLLNCKNVSIENITVSDADGWTIRLISCENVNIDGVNVLGYQSNSDGIDICSCRNAKLKNCFVRTSDDCLVIKSMPGGGECHDVDIEGCTIWADRAGALEIGHEVCYDIYNISFKNIDIINQVEETYGYHAIDITNVDTADVYNVSYEDIRIEECVRILGLRIREGRFSDVSSVGNGVVRNITFKNITSAVDRPIFISGRNSEKLVSDVSFENFVIAGEKMTDTSKIKFNPYVRNISVTDGKEFLGYPENFTPINIRPMCNHILGEDRGIYGLKSKDWITMPEGISVWEGVPFDIAGQGKLEEGSYKRVVVPPNRLRYPFLAKTEVSLKADWLFFLHTGVNILSEAGKILCKYVVTYEDNTKAEILIDNQNDCNEWNTWSLGGWQPVHEGIRMYIKPWQNPEPEKQIKSIEMLDGEINDMAVLLAITAGNY